jgi:hypothetical protein
MYYMASRAWCQAVGPRVDRGVRPRCALLESRHALHRCRLSEGLGLAAAEMLTDLAASARRRERSFQLANPRRLGTWS